MREGRALPASPERELVEKRLSWHYDAEELPGITAKMTVSEIKQRFAESLREDEPAALPIAPTAPPVWRRPQFLQQKGRLSPAERGTLMHSIMQNLDLHGDLTREGLRAQVARMEVAGMIAAGHEDAVNYASIESFCQSSLGQRMQQAVRVWRELPFSRMISVGEVNPAYAGSSERMSKILFMSKGNGRGVIDVLFEEADGSLVLLDYKTDRDTTPEKIAATTPSRSSSTAKPSNPSSARMSKRASCSCSKMARVCGFLDRDMI